MWDGVGWGGVCFLRLSIGGWNSYTRDSIFAFCSGKSWQIELGSGRYLVILVEACESWSGYYRHKRKEKVLHYLPISFAFVWLACCLAHTATISLCFSILEEEDLSLSLAVCLGFFNHVVLFFQIVLCNAFT